MTHRITVTDDSDSSDKMPIEIGYQGENLATTVEFDISAWVNMFGDGTCMLLHHRKGETPYPVAMQKKGNIAYWAVTNVDTGKNGSGYCELQYYVGDVLVKSSKWRTHTKDSLGEAGDPPEPWDGFLSQVTELAATAENAAKAAQESAKSIEDMTVSAHSVTGDPTVDKTVDEGILNIDFGIPSGGGGEGGALPPGGTAGQILVKNSSLDNDASWQDLPVYDGSYEVTPLVNADTLMQTGKTYLDRDVVVKAIPYQEVSNGSGGLTITIGG